MIRHSESLSTIVLFYSVFFLAFLSNYAACLEHTYFNNCAANDSETATPSPPVLTPALPAESSRENRSVAVEKRQQHQQQPKRGKIKSMRLRRCPQCSYSSPSSKALAQHVAVRHRPHRLRCGHCGHTSHYPSWMRKHSRKSHPDLPSHFINMETGDDDHGKNHNEVVDDGNLPAEDDGGNFPADGGEISQDSVAASPLELEEELSDDVEDDQMTMGNATSLILISDQCA